jgi:hypothetical protein
MPVNLVETVKFVGKKQLPKAYRIKMIKEIRDMLLLAASC